MYCMMIDVLQWLFRVAGIRGKSRERGSSAGGRESEAQEAVQRGTVYSLFFFLIFQNRPSLYFSNEKLIMIFFPPAFLAYLA